MSNEEINNIESENLDAETINNPEVDITEDPAALLEDARNKADQHWNELLRAKADMENLRRRQARDLENAHKHALDKFVTELLPIYDSMELGLKAASGEEASLEAVREGLEMTMKMFLSSISKFGLEQVDPEGQAFDPELHQAVAMQATEGVAANQVLNVMQKGYQFNGRLLRPAIVVVSQ
ncbi:MAG: nucleotide exchange factor GrpE [Gammaproteobacteria bacterium]|nr:nucleotide exchange factor GrpE [Gammaproteobacteria bacterium]